MKYRANPKSRKLFRGQDIGAIEVQRIDKLVPPYEAMPFDIVTKFEDSKDYKEVLEACDRRLTPLLNKRLSKLKNLPEFQLSDFENSPEMTGRKIFLTIQHIIDNHQKEDWYKAITDYIEYVTDSFGLVPNGYGEPVFLNEYLKYIKNFLEENKKLEEKKHLTKNIDRLLAYIQDFFFTHYVYVGNNHKELLLKIYQEWKDIFPFELPFFNDLKDELENLIPLSLESANRKNRYILKPIGKLLTKKEAIDVFCNLTERIIHEIDNTFKKYENGLLTTDNIDTFKESLVAENRRLELRKYRTSDEDYIKILEDWFEGEKQFLLEIKPLLNTVNNVSSKNNNKLSLRQIALIHVYEGKHIDKSNADDIAKTYKHNSGDKLKRHFDLYRKSINRTGLDESKKKTTNKLDLINSIISRLKPKNQKRALDELDILKQNIENEFP